MVLSLLALTHSCLCPLSSFSVCTDGHSWDAVFWQMAVTQRGVQIKTNIQTFHLLPSFPMLTLCTFQQAGWDFPVFPTPKAVADLWSKFSCCSRTTNCAETCWLKTLLKMCRHCQMWLIHDSEKLRAAGGHFLLIFSCTILKPKCVCLLSISWWLMAHHCYHNAGGRSHATCSQSCSRRVTWASTNHWGFHTFGWVCLKLRDFHVAPLAVRAEGMWPCAGSTNRQLGKTSPPNPVPCSSKQTTISWLRTPYFWTM